MSKNEGGGGAHPGMRQKQKLLLARSGKSPFTKNILQADIHRA